MTKYKINFIFNKKNDIDDILIKTLKRELQNYLNNDTWFKLQKISGEEKYGF